MDLSFIFAATIFINCRSCSGRKTTELPIDIFIFAVSRRIHHLYSAKIVICTTNYESHTFFTNLQID
jgi:hypothetical protein